MRHELAEMRSNRHRTGSATLRIVMPSACIPTAARADRGFAVASRGAMRLGHVCSRFAFNSSYSDPPPRAPQPYLKTAANALGHIDIGGVQLDATAGSRPVLSAAISVVQARRPPGRGWSCCGQAGTRPPP